MQEVDSEHGFKALLEERQNSSASSCPKPEESESNFERDEMVSFYAELPSDLQQAMRGFIEQYPNWDQYRLIKAALAGFLVQNGLHSREITRLYVGNMFSSDSI